MATDREKLLQVMALRAGFTERQVDALRRRDYAALLQEEPPLGTGPSGGRGPGRRVGDVESHDTVGHDTEGHGFAPLGEETGSSADLRAALERASVRLATVRRQRDAAVDLLRQLATRLGCCPECWGSEPACARCGGLGSPGCFPPDAGLLEWLGPALDRVPPTGGHEPAR